MQPYYALKLKCFVVRMMAGSAVFLMGINIIAAIIREMSGSYDAASRLAYILGLVIAAAMGIFGMLMMHQAVHFEKYVFGHSQNYALFKKDLEKEDVVSSGNLVVTGQFVLLFSMRLLKMCTVIRMDDIIGCFENPVYGSITKPTEYTIYIYDRKFKLHPIVLDSKYAENGHMAREKICQQMPWIFQDNRDAFMDQILTKSGRRNIFKQLDKAKYTMQSTRDVEQEAETELNQLANEAREKLNFHSILGKVKKKNH